MSSCTIAIAIAIGYDLAVLISRLNSAVSFFIILNPNSNLRTEFVIESIITSRIAKIMVGLAFPSVDVTPLILKVSGSHSLLH